MDIHTLKRRFAFVLTLGALVATGVACGEERTVGTVPALVTALTELNGNSANTIIVSEGFYDVKDCSMGDACLAVSNLTLKGTTENPRDVVIYDSSHLKRIFICAKGQIHNLTVSNGYHSTKHGAGVLGTDHYYSKLKNVVITRCEAPNGEGVGCCELAELRDCQLIGNVGRYGGGANFIYYGEWNKRRFGVIGGVIRDNAVTVSGGGLMNCVVSGALIANNTAGFYGGGMFSQSAYDAVADCTIVSNSATYGGGGVYSSGTGTPEQHFTVTNSLIAENFALHCGGGLYFPSRAWAVDCVISNNVCDGAYESDRTGHGGGGGACCVNLVGGTVIGNSITNNAFRQDDSSMFGGGGLLDCLFVTNVLIACNSTVNRGGGADSCVLVDCIVSNNLSHYYGGGVSRSSVTDSDLVFNIVRNTNGYQPYFVKTGSCLGLNGLGGAASVSFVTNSLVAGNACIPTSRVAEPTGAAGYNTVFSGCEIRENFALYVPTLNEGSAFNCTFRDNASKTGSHAFRNVTALEGCDICGAQFMNLGRIVNCRVHDFVTDGYATIAEGANVYTSGVFSVSGSPTLFNTWNGGNYPLAATNVLIDGNHCKTLFYGVKGESLHLANCSVISNRYAGIWDSMGVEEGAAEAVNLLFVGNRTKDGSEACDYNISTWTGNTNAVMRNCIFGVKGNYDYPRDARDCVFGATVRFIEPQDPEWPYQPRRKSCAVGKGLVQDWMSAATDVRGQPRLREGKVDIGCYQNFESKPGFIVIAR